MTELIDLATLASLGQHFATLEDVAEMRASLLKFQNDLSLIKNFLATQFGADFDEAENEEEYYEPAPVRAYPVTKRRPTAPTQVRQVISGRPMNFPRVQQMVQPRSKPPPLQRFTVISSGSNASNWNGNRSGSGSRIGNSVSQSANNGGGGANGDSKTFRRNFLSMSALKKPAGTVSVNNGRSPSGGKSNGMGSMQKMNQGQGLDTSPNDMPRLKMEKIVENAEEENYYEEYNDSGETGYQEEDENYDESAQMTVEEGEMKFDASSYGNQEDDGQEYLVEGQENDGLVYEESYEGEEMELNDGNGDNSSGSSQQHQQQQQQQQRSTRTLANGTKLAVPSKKPNQRRISMPAAITSSSSSSAAASQNQLGGEDSDMLKNCKVCHEDVPAFALFNHVINEHYNGEVPTCTICKKTFTYKQGLISHMRYHDAQKYDKACSYCGKRFIRRSDVIIHERRLHTGERPYLCPVPQCNQGFVRRYCLLTHIKTNHGEPYMSQVMAQSGRRKSS